MKHSLLFAGLVMLYNGNCSGKEPTVIVEEIRELQGVASASGIEETAAGIYVIGDNTPYIFLLDDEFQIRERYLLFPNNNLPDSLYEKNVKPDLEALCKLDDAGEVNWLFGSGSGYPERDILVEFNTTRQTETIEYSLVDFYAGLREAAGLSKNELNIEAAVVVENDLYLFNRGENMIFKLKVSQFKKFLKDQGTFPIPEISRYELPEIKGIKAGFSGATYFPDRKLFLITASVENTSNWINDGEVLGSFLGVLDLQDFSRKKESVWTLLTHKGQPLIKKVESITCVTTSAKDSVNLLMVTDSDGGISEIIKARLFNF